MAINIKFDGKVNSKYTIKLSDIINNPSNFRTNVHNTKNLEIN